MDPLTTDPQYLTETGRNEDGKREAELDPPPNCIPAEDLTLDVFYRVCFCLQEDPEEVLAGKPVEVPERPPITHVQKILDLLVQNRDDYEVAEMHPADVQVILAAVTDYFIHASHGK